MNSPQKNARIAGLLYLLMGITSAIGLLYTPSKLIVAGNASLTAKNIITSGSLFRFGMVSSLIGQIVFIFLVLALYRLLKSVDKTQARLMVIFVVIAVPIMFMNTIVQMGALQIISGADYLKVFEPEILNALMMIFLNVYSDGIFIIGVFWGLWLFPFGILVYKSGFFPRILGIFLIINCFGYLVDSFTHLLLPGYYGIVSKITIAPMCIGEFSIILWLLIMGVKLPEAKPISVPEIIS